MTLRNIKETSYEGKDTKVKKDWIFFFPKKGITKLQNIKTKQQQQQQQTYRRLSKTRRKQITKELMNKLPFVENFTKGTFVMF